MRTDERRSNLYLGAFVAALVSLQIANNLLPYAGLRDDSCQTMFSGLSWDEDSNNHFFMPQRPLGDRWQYLWDVEATLEPSAPAHGRVADLARWLNQPNRVLNVDAVRAVVWQVCRTGHRVSLRYGDPITRRPMRDADACHGRYGRPSFWIPVRLYETDTPAVPE